MGIKFNPLLPSGLDLTGDSASAFSYPIGGMINWGTASGGYYTLTILASTHGKGTSPAVQVFESIGGGNYDLVIPETIRINSSGDISIIVPEIPDLRFIGKVIIK
jgi:hypothetical protein